MKINLASNNWVHQRGVSVAGEYLYKSLYRNDKLHNDLSRIKTKDDLQSIIAKIHGSFALVIRSGSFVYLVTDNVRSIPIFYSVEYNFITDRLDVGITSRISSMEFDTDSVGIFKRTGYVLNERSLLKSINQVESAQIVLLGAGKVIKNNYWSYSVTRDLSFSKPNFTNLKSESIDILDKISNRVVSLLDGRQAVVPLSGGYDSRLILSLLKLKNYTNIVCFTYGSYRSPEVQIAKAICTQLKVKLITIDFNKNFFEKEFEYDEFENFVRFASNYISLPHMQDFYAVKHMFRSKLIHKNAVFLPGHSGDIFAGTHIMFGVDSTSSRDEVIKGIVRKHFAMNKNVFFDPSRIAYDDMCHPQSNMELWSWRERQSKFIVNSVMTYKFFGYSFILPLWDPDLAHFYSRVPLEFKNRRARLGYIKDKNLYDCVCSHFFKQLKIESFLRPSEPRLIRMTRRLWSKLFSLDGINNLDLLLDAVDRCSQSKQNASARRTYKFNENLINITLNIYNAHNP